MLSLLFGAMLVGGLPGGGIRIKPIKGYIGGGFPVYSSRREKLKGYMKEARRTGRGHGRKKHKTVK